MKSGDEVRTLLNPFFYMSGDDLATRFANGATVTTVLDLSVYVNSVTSTNNAALPSLNTTGINNVPSLDFTSATTYCLEKVLSTTPIYAPRSFAMVMSFNSIAAGSRIIWDMNIAGGNYFQLSSSGGVLTFTSGSAVTTLTQTTTVSTPVILVGNVNGSASFFSINGVKSTGSLTSVAATSAEKINVAADATHTQSLCPGMRVGMIALSEKVLTEQDHFELVNLLSAHYQIAANLT